MKKFIQRFVPMYHGFLNKMSKLVRGNPIVISDASDNALQGLRIFGKSTQNGTPTPDAPVEIVSVENPVISLCGKNLFDMSKINSTDKITKNADGTLSVSNYANSTQLTLKELAPALCVGMKYKLNIDTDGAKFIYLTVLNSAWDNNKELEITENALNSLVNVYGMNGQTDGSTTIRSIQIVLSGISSEYEQYKGTQSITFPNVIRGIPVTSGGNYTDADGQQWICDEVDFERGVYVQRIGSETKTIVFSEKDATGRFVAIRVFDHYYKSGTSPCICNVARWLSSAAQNQSCCVVSRNFYYKNDNYTLTEINELFSNLSVQITAMLSEPIETPLTAEQIEAYKSLHTNEPNTTISNDQNAWVEVKYISK